MSVEAMSFVMNLTVGSAPRKLVLLGYANHAHKDGTSAFPSVATVAEYAECHERTVRRHIDALVANGYMREGDQKIVAHLPPYSRPIVYDVAMSKETVAQWRAAYEQGERGSARAMAAAVGAEGGRLAAQVRWKDRATPGDSVSGGGDSVSGGPGDSVSGGPGDTVSGGPGDTAVSPPLTQLRQPPPDTAASPKPSLEPSLNSSSSPSAPGALPTTAGGGGGGSKHKPTDGDFLLVLTPELREHPTVRPAALRQVVDDCYSRGWTNEQIRDHLVGVETAQHPGAAALTRLRELVTRDAPVPRTRPPWCGSCSSVTRRLEDPQDGSDRGPCPSCHPSRASQHKTPLRVVKP